MFAKFQCHPCVNIDNTEEEGEKKEEKIGSNIPHSRHTHKNDYVWQGKVHITGLSNLSVILEFILEEKLSRKLCLALCHTIISDYIRYF